MVGFCITKKCKSSLIGTGDFFNEVDKEAAEVASTAATITLVCYTQNWSVKGY
jgi:hypothetical protein